MMNRRRLMRVGALAGAGLAAQAWPSPAKAAGPALDPAELERFWAGNEYMNSLGPRMTGNPAHREFTDFIETELRAISGMRVHRDRTTFTRWEAKGCALELETGPVPVASEFPYSGDTGPQGIHAELIYLDDLTGSLKLISGAAAGKIVVIEAGPVPMTNSTFNVLNRRTYDPDGTIVADDDFTRTWTTLTPLLNSYRHAGAVGAIVILDVSPENARGQFVPWLFPLAYLPALIVDRETGRQVRERAIAGAKAFLRLDATIEKDASTDDVIGVLPGASREISLVNTHTDGPNALEENGVLGLLALARQQAAIPRLLRNREHVFLFSTGHFAAEVGDAQRFIGKYPDWLCRTASALTVEHLGAMEWVDGPAGYQPTGRTETMITFTSNNPALYNNAIDGIVANDLRRTRVLKPILNSFFFGVGGFLSLVGVPTIGFIGGPNYLVSQADDGHIGKLSPKLAFQQLQTCADILDRCNGTPAAALRFGGTIITGGGCVLPPIVGTGYGHMMDALAWLSAQR